MLDASLQALGIPPGMGGKLHHKRMLHGEKAALMGL